MMRRLFPASILCTALMASASVANADDPVTIGTTSGNAGEYLTDVSGKALYMFELDSPGVSKCVDEKCAADWPPLVSPSFQAPKGY